MGHNDFGGTSMNYSNQNKTQNTQNQNSKQNKTQNTQTQNQNTNQQGRNCR